MNPRHADYTEKRVRYWNQFAEKLNRWLPFTRTYRRRLEEIYAFLIPPGMRVLEIGCGQGDLLASLKPSVGVGLDFSHGMLERARAKHPDLRFVEGDAHDIDLDEQFDYVVLSDLVNELYDVQQVLERIAPLVHANSRIVLNSYSRIWEIPRRIAEALRLVHPQLPQNWLTPPDIGNMLHLAGFETIRSFREILWPIRTPLLDGFANRYLVKLSPMNLFALTNVLVARRQPEPNASNPGATVVVPARNEAGNIARILAEVPRLGSATELIFVEGNSTDDTYEAIEKELALHPEAADRLGAPPKLFRQSGKGKGDAVRLGFAHATQDVLMILDADLTVPAADLTRFFEAWRSGKGDFINGVRLVYPMEEGAMRFFNLIGNRFFSAAFTWLLDQNIKDTLCGTKVLGRPQYETIAANRGYFGQLDPFGDFDLIFGAAKYTLKIVDLPVRYRERTYGETNIQRWSHGWLLLRMVALALRRIKFV